MRRLLSTILCLSLTVSCKKETPIVIAEQLTGEWSILVGKWNWTHSDHQYGWCSNETYFETRTPLNQSTTYELEFKEEGLIRFFRNSELIKESKIVFHYFNGTDPNQVLFNIYQNNDESQSFSGNGDSDLMNFSRYPFLEESGCGDFNNFFIKE